MNAFTIGLIIGAFFVAGGSAAFNYWWCALRHKRPGLGIAAGVITFMCGLVGGLILAVPFTMLFMICGVAFSKKDDSDGNTNVSNKPQQPQELPTQKAS